MGEVGWGEGLTWRVVGCFVVLVLIVVGRSSRVTEALTECHSSLGRVQTASLRSLPCDSTRARRLAEHRLRRKNKFVQQAHS